MIVKEEVGPFQDDRGLRAPSSALMKLSQGVRNIAAEPESNFSACQHK
jgi:hypothetical protein